ncbi:MAG: histidine phosphatase family protein [Pseudomonadota bacterium]
MPTTVILGRHAEKAQYQGRDPELTVAGRRRAAHLAGLLSQTPPDAVFATEYRRTRQTVAPLAVQAGIAVESVPAADVEALAARIRAQHQGQTVVVAAHSNTVPALVSALGGEAVPPIAESDYANLYVVTLPASGPAATLHLRFGNATTQ